MADAAGVEPATAWFVARYSIQLSYASAIHYVLYLSLKIWKLLPAIENNGGEGGIRTLDPG